MSDRLARRAPSRIPSVDAALTAEQAEQLAALLVRLLASAVDGLERRGVDPRALLEDSEAASGGGDGGERGRRVVGIRS